MTATATRLVHTSSRAQDNRDRLARVAAAGRVEADRKARAAREAANRARRMGIATAWVAEVVADGGVRVGFKVCDDFGKHRFAVDVADAAEVLVNLWGGDVEAWAVRADGEYCTSVW
jgi:hypothetical protein